jgi:hypothetical protein
MVAASTDPIVSRARHIALARVLCASSACVGLASGGATLLMQAGIGQRATSLWMSALMLLVMMSVPLLMSRSCARHTMLASAATLIATLTAMNSVPVYLNSSAHGTVIAVLMMATGIGMSFYRLCVLGPSIKQRHDLHRRTHDPVDTAPASAATALLALLAGLSSGSLARFQLFAICGVSGAQPFWQIALLLAAVCALAFIADRSRGNRVLIALYVARAALIGTLAASDNPALAPFAATLFLALDCLTIPALVNLRARSNSVSSASCPGLAHHVGMVLGAALSTTPYFFGDGFVVLYALGAAANLICAASLAVRWRATHLFRPHSNPYRRQTNPSG